MSLHSAFKMKFKIMLILCEKKCKKNIKGSPTSRQQNKING